MKKMFSCLFVILLLVCPASSGCASKSDNSGSSIHYVDKDFITSLGKGLEARWKLNDQYDAAVDNGSIKKGSSESKKSYGEWVDAELNEVDQYRNKPFKDSKLQQLALQYIEALNNQKNSLKDWGTDKFNDEWHDAYNERTKILTELVDDYDLKVSKQYQDNLDTLKSEGNQVKENEKEKEAVESLTKSFNFQQTADDYGFKTYTAIVENTSGYNLKSFSADISLVNADGVLVDTEYANADNWQAGQKAQFQFETDTEFTSTTITINSWEDDQGNSSYSD